MVIDYKFAVVTPERGKGGVDAADAPKFARWLEEAGVDMLHVAQANHTGNMADTIPPMGVQPYGFFADIAGQVKEAVSIPVSTVGRIIDPAMAERIVESEKADIIGLGRPLLCDPDWPNKAQSGCACDIRRCISCNKGCTDNIQNRAFLACVLNAENGYERTRSITPAAEKRNVAVVGGGPAGLEAARVAALRGHSVTLFERAPELGRPAKHCQRTAPQGGNAPRRIGLDACCMQSGSHTAPWGGSVCGGHFGHEAGRCDRSCGGVQLCHLPSRARTARMWPTLGPCWQANNRSMDAWPSLEAVWWDARLPNIWPDTVVRSPLWR